MRWQDARSLALRQAATSPGARIGAAIPAWGVVRLPGRRKEEADPGSGRDPQEHKLFARVLNLTDLIKA